MNDASGFAADLLGRAAKTAAPVRLEKMSGKTKWCDVSTHYEMPEAMLAALRQGRSVGDLWRARVGTTHRRWWWGWSAEEALAKALENAGSLEP